MSRAFLDAASGQPWHLAARRALDGFADRTWADPFSTTYEGRLAAQVLDAARETAAAVIGVRPGNVAFRRAGSDAAKQAIRSCATNAPSPAIAVVATEREVVLQVVGESSDLVRHIGVDAQGHLDLNELESQLAADRASLACVQFGNVEIGTLQPIEQIAEICARYGAKLLSDATGALGLCELASGWSTLFADAGGWAGPRGMAIVAQAQGNAGFDASDQGFDDVAGAVAAAAALDAVARGRVTESARLAALVDLMRQRIPELISDVEMLGDPIAHLPNTLTFSCLYVDGEQLAAELDRAGFATGSGSACAARSGLSSHVLTAIGALTHGNVRVTLPIGCPRDHVERFLIALPDAVTVVRAQAGM